MNILDQIMEEEAIQEAKKRKDRDDLRQSQAVALTEQMALDSFHSQILKAILPLNGYRGFEVEVAKGGVFGEVAHLWRRRSRPDMAFGAICVQKVYDKIRYSDDTPEVDVEYTFLRLKHILNPEYPSATEVRVQIGNPESERVALESFLKQIAPILLDPRPLQDQFHHRR